MSDDYVKKDSLIFVNLGDKLYLPFNTSNTSNTREVNQII